MNQDDRDFLKSFYRALPDGPLEPDDPRYWAIYDDPRIARWDPVEQLARSIEWSDGGHVQLLAGSRGSGRSTELRRLARRLQDAGHLVAFVDADVPIERHYATSSGVMPSREGLFLWIPVLLAKGCFESFGNLLGDEIQTELLEELKTSLKRRVESFPSGERISKHSTIAELFRHISNLWAVVFDQQAEAIMPVFLEFLRRLVGVARESTEHRIVVLVDSVDRILQQQNRLLRLDLNNLRIDGLFVVLTVDASTADDRLLWDEFHDEPRWVEPLDTRGSCFADVFEGLSAHLAKLGDWRRILDEDGLKELLKLSGGGFGDIFHLLGQIALNAKSLPAHRLVVERVIEKAREDLAHPLDEHELSVLRSVADGRELWQAVKSEELDEAARFLLKRGRLLHRQDGFFVHPLLEPVLAKDRVSIVAAMPSATAEAGIGASGEAVHLRALAIENVRVFEDFRLELHPPESSTEGQWTLFLGDNGVGKTTILRSLVLALAEQRAADALFQLLGPSAPFLREGSEEGHVEVQLDGRTYRAHLTRDRRGIERISDLHRPEDGVLVYAYGCQRGTALGGPSREVEFRPLDDVRTVFDPTAHLIHAETWLSRLRLAALEDRGGSDESFFEAVRDTLVRSLAGVDALDVDKNGVWLSGPNVDRAPLGALSDGYITTTGWILDLIARWSDRCRKLGMTLDGDFREAMTGLVLIDEIDLHLHPLWQVEVVDDLRKLFPRLSFVATTHNPLTLLGARAGEIHILQRDEGRVVSLQRDIPPGTRADQVLTGEWFGLPSTLDDGTLGLLDRHLGLLREGVPRDDPGRRELEKELRHRLGTFADTSVDRMVQSIAADLMPESLEELSPVERQDIRRKILERARARREAGAA